MIKIRHIVILLALVLLILAPRPSFSVEDAKDSANKPLPVEIDADSLSFDQVGNVYIAEGNVVAKQSGVTLMADRIVIDMKEGILIARGNLKGFDEGGNELSGDFIELDLNLEAAILINGKLFFKGNNVYITSDEIRKVGPQTYEADNITYTACDCDEGADKKPAWSITSKSAKVTLGEYFAGWHTLFRIKDVPILYLPYVKVPINRERQSGFLLPTPGISDVRGASLKNYLFWAIDRSNDVTFTLDTDVKRGVGAGLEFRHYSRRLSYSEFNFNYYREKDIDRVRTFRENVQNLSRPLTAGDSRWETKFSHDETLPLAFKVRADIHIVSDDEYLIDFEEDDDKRATPSLESTVSITRNWQLYSFVSEFRVFDNLLDADDDDVLQKIPEVTFTALPRKFFSSPIYLSMDSSFVNFARKNNEEGQRVDVAPRVSLPIRPGSYFELTPSFTPRYTGYLITGTAGSRDLNRFIFEFRTDMVTTFIRDFSTPEGATSPMRHSIRPRLFYRYVPGVDQSSLPTFDDLDMIEEANEVGYSLNTTLSYMYREDKSLKRHEYLYLDLSQVYDFNEAQRSLTGPGDKRLPFGALKGELRFSPFKSVRLVADGDFNVHEGSFDRYDTSIKVADKRGDTFYASYRFDRSLQTSYMEGSTRVRVHKSLDLIFKKRYSFDEERALETLGAVEFRQQCWGVILTYKRTPEENLFLLNFSLKSLGDLMTLSESM